MCDSLRLAVLVVGLTSFGCDGDEGVDAGVASDAGGSDAGAADAGPMDVDAGPPATEEITMSFVLFGSGVLAEGVELCEADTTSCATSTALGRATLTVNVGVESFLRMGGTGFQPSILPFRDLGLANGVTFNAPGPTVIDDLYVSAGVTPDPALGTIILLPQTGSEGLAITSSSGQVFYTGDGRDRMVDPALTAVPSGPVPVVFIANVDVGEATLTQTGTASPCEALFGWAGSTAGELRMPVEAATMVADNLICL